ncbi:peroxide stress protein YaaA [Noviherbaspirillum galbum]|uniref:UPF0246 protein G3574_01850 n=1 Tax=Noviherbaspirillum galbum TaxID=2709383 RepID=A0A6B3SN47_9BURK|nr:peroxide stress protein YaaA [Noviherbaspirillum galbum]NEX59812.1 peroxide stress protein YaaA [Noviherbaspirillum galbum]
MLIVLSPAKTLDYDTPPVTDEKTLPEFIPQAAELIEVLRKLSAADVASLMDVSDSIATLNVARFASWSRRFTSNNAKQAVLAFDGDVYDGLQAPSLSPKQLAYLQSSVRILSGLYGVLRPLDLMQPYRLEMGTRLANGRGKDLYTFWGDQVTQAINAALASQKGKRGKVLVNLASEEYFKVVKPRLLDAPVITPVFEDWKNGRYKVISFFAKRARGLMARHAAVNNISQPAKLKEFSEDGYAFDAEASSDAVWVFRRRTGD